MPNAKDKPYGDFETFDQFFLQAEQRPGYWIERAKLAYTEEVLSRMTQVGVSRSQLACRMNVQPGFVTRLLNGRNNFELATMVRIARALDSEFRCHLQPKGTVSQWVDFLTEEPARPSAQAPASWGSEDFTKIVQLPHSIQNEPVRATA